MRRGWGDASRNNHNVDLHSRGGVWRRNYVGRLQHQIGGTAQPADDRTVAGRRIEQQGQQDTVAGSFTQQLHLHLAYTG